MVEIKALHFLHRTKSNTYSPCPQLPVYLQRQRQQQQQRSFYARHACKLFYSVTKYRLQISVIIIISISINVWNITMTYLFIQEAQLLLRKSIIHVVWNSRAAYDGYSRCGNFKCGNYCGGEFVGIQRCTVVFKIVHTRAHPIYLFIYFCSKMQVSK